MSLHVVACLHDQTKGVVTLESDKRDFSQAISELQSAEARNVAISAAAAKGRAAPWCTWKPSAKSPRAISLRSKAGGLWRPRADSNPLKPARRIPHQRHARRFVVFA